MGSENSIPIGPRELQVWVGDLPYEPVQVRDSPENGNIVIVVKGGVEILNGNDTVTFQLNDFYVECPVKILDTHSGHTRIHLDMQKCVPTDRPEVFRVLEDHELDLTAEFEQ